MLLNSTQNMIFLQKIELLIIKWRMLFPRDLYAFGKRNYSLSKRKVQIGQALSGALHVMLRDLFQVEMWGKLH